MPRPERRVEEGQSVALAFATLLGILGAYTVLETARDALFLARLSTSELPYIYLVMAGLAVGLAEVSRHGLGVPRRLRLAALLVGGGLVTGAFFFLHSASHPWLLRAFYVWTGAVMTLAGVQFWVLLGEVYTITEAKRLYRSIGTGSLLGAALGGGVARLATGRWPTQALILLGAAVMLASAAGAYALGRRARRDIDVIADGRWRFGDVRGLLRREPYVTRLALLAFISSVAVTIANFVFKNEVALHVAASDLGQFFATFYALLNVAALLVQLIFMGWILRVWDIHRALWALPLLMFSGSAGLLLGGALAAAVLLKGADGVLRPSIHRTSTELLFLPIPDGLRSRVKPAIDVIGQRGGQAVASVVILGSLVVRHGDFYLVVALAALCVAWVFASAELRPHYVEMFRRALREGTIAAQGGLPEMDLGSLETLFASLNSRDDAEVLAALELLDAEERTHLVPVLILYHPAPAVAIRALELFEGSGRRDFVPIAERLLESPIPDVRNAALRALDGAAPDARRLTQLLGDSSPLVRATALAGLLAAAEPEQDARVLQEVVIDQKSPEARRALARAMERRPVPAFVPVVEALLRDADDEVQVALVRTIAGLKEESFLPHLLEQLRREAVRPEARRALRAFGGVGLRFLEQALRDGELPQELRRHIPRAIATFAASDAVSVLQQCLVSEPDGMVRFRILRALGRVAARHPEVTVDRGLVTEATERSIGVACRLAHWRHALEEAAVQQPRRRTPGHELLLALLRDKETHAQGRLFRLLGLRYRHEDFHRIHRGLRSGDPRVRASSRELLENVLRPPLKAAVLALVDDLPPADRRSATAPFFTPEIGDYESVVGALIEQPVETLRSLGVFLVGEQGLHGHRGRLEALRTWETSLFVKQMVERTLQALDAAGGLHAGG